MTIGLHILAAVLWLVALLFAWLMGVSANGSPKARDAMGPISVVGGVLAICALTLQVIA